jgi:enoyl-CoA hydratase/carnithine racemase
MKDLKDENGRSPAAAIQQVGATRRVFVLDNHMTGEEMDGLAHRIKVLSKNSSLTSILLSSNLEVDSDDDVDHLLPSSVVGVGKDSNPLEAGMSTSKDEGEVWDIAAGYDARALRDASADEKRQVINAMMKLTLAVRGGKANAQNAKNEYISKIPFISVPHGLTSDGGYALSMGSYVLATPDSRFRITNPMKGLSLDPIGLSYILPRLGWEFQQPSAHFPLGSILALSGYVADGTDMVESGLATHYIDSPRSIELLERALSQLPPYNQQTLRKNPTTRYGYTGSEDNLKDVNAQYRNVAVANIIHASSAFDAAGQEYANFKDQSLFLAGEDPSLVLDSEKGDFIGERESMLLSVAATFEDAFKKEESITGTLEKMREYASADATNEEEEECVRLAKEVLDGMEAQSPLALHAVHKLMSVGKGGKESLESCMEREKGVLLKLFEKEDYKNWANSGVDVGEFKDWKHKSVHEVTPDEVRELFSN